MAEQISMADLMARNLAIEWFEAVSLVREVCTILLAAGVEGSTPALTQILLAPTGRVTITGTAHGDAPVRRLGQLLQALLLRTTGPPVTLRLVLSEAMSAPPVYASAAELDAALAYFERPDRYAVLQGLYERATSIDADAADTASIQDLDEIAPLPQAPAARRKPRRPANRRATAVVVCGALAVAAVIVAYQRQLLFRDGSLKTAGVRASTAVDKAVFATVSAVTEVAGMGKLVAPGTELPPEVPAPAAPSLTAPRKRAAARTAPITLAGVPIRLFDPQASHAIVPAVASPAAMPSAVLEASADPSHVADTKVYGPEDTDVEAPLAIRPHLPTSLPAGVAATQLARIELVVAPDGLVEAVKLMPGTRPVTVTEAMLLSAAKAWRFTPAIRRGEAVRYRKTVFLSER